MLTIDLPPRLENRLEKLAAQTGKSKAFYIQQAIDKLIDEFEANQEHSNTSFNFDLERMKERVEGEFVTVPHFEATNFEDWSRQFDDWIERQHA